MKKLILICLLPVLMLMSACGHCGKQQANTEGEVAAAVEKLRLAMISASRADLEAVTADNLLYIHSAGLRETKAEFVDTIASGRNVFVSIALSNQQIKMSGDTAIVYHVFEAKTNNNGEPGSVKIGIMQTWQKQCGAWKLSGRLAQKLL